jgi:2-phospho-L-lactate guanylyltransferase
VPVVAVLPVKSFRLGKGRMAEELSLDERTALGQRLAEHTASVVIESGMVPVLVAGDGEVADWAITLGLPSIPDPGPDLNAAATAGMLWAGAAASPWLVLHTDLPLLTLADLSEVSTAQERTGWVLGPSADGGTSALGGRGDARFSYGPGSFHLHLGRFPQAGIVTRPGLLHDVDSYADLESARRHRRGSWLNDLR